MKIKNTIKPYYHLLYRTLKIADVELSSHKSEEMVALMIDDIVRLDALISLLVYVDGSIPLLRTQKAFSLLKAELEGLSYLHREQRLMAGRSLNFIDWKLGDAIDSEIEVISREFNMTSHQLYLNAIHSGEKAIDNHLNHISEDKVIVGVLAYFTDCLAEIEEKSIDLEIHLIGYLVRGLLSNLNFIAQLGQGKSDIQLPQFFKLIKEMIANLKLLHIYENTISAIGSDNDVVGDVANEIMSKYQDNLEKVIECYDQVVKNKEAILDYVSSKILKEDAVSEQAIRKSIHARNLMHSLT